MIKVKIFTVRFIKKKINQEALFLSPQWLAQSGFVSGEKVLFRVGSKVKKVSVIEQNGCSDNHIYLSSKMKNLFPFIQGTKMRFILDCDKKTVQIGPVVGLLTTMGPKGFSSIYREWLIEAQKEGYLAFVFSIRDVKPNQKAIMGLTYGKIGNRGLWIKRIFPLPDVVYNQIRSRRAESCLKVKAFRKSFLAKKGKGFFYNTSFLNKEKVTAMLNQLEVLGPNLPETKKFIGSKDCLQMLDKYSSIYLKPVNGSLGMGIIKFTRPQLACYRYQAYAGPRKAKGKSVAAESLASVTKRLTAGKSYLIQQGINLLEIEGCPFDIRVLLQKNSSGSWVETHSFAKIAAKGNFATNVAAGGSVATIREVLSRVSQQAGNNSEELAGRIRDLSFLVAKAMDEKMGPFGELGLDIGVDKEGRIWLIEVNSKYSRHIFPKEVRRVSLIRTLEYARWLTGLTWWEEIEESNSEEEMLENKREPLA